MLLWKNFQFVLIMIRLFGCHCNVVTEHSSMEHTFLCTSKPLYLVAVVRFFSKLKLSVIFLNYLNHLYRTDVIILTLLWQPWIFLVSYHYFLTYFTAYNYWIFDSQGGWHSILLVYFVVWLCFSGWMHVSTRKQVFKQWCHNVWFSKCYLWQAQYFTVYYTGCTC